ncbi:hypothetical protein KBD75_03030 [Candidatus Woesebacteria bacterium]|nr:hypothetical protein [Candidatus Woesebacteria bacterium]
MNPFFGETMLGAEIVLPNDSDTRTSIEKASKEVRIIVGADGSTAGHLYEKGPKGQWLAQLFSCLPGVDPIILPVESQIASGLRKVWSK